MISKLVKMIKEGKVFVYPTDTVYGLGCDAFNEDAVLRIKEIKGRDKEKPLSVIAPSKAWISENLFVEEGLLGKYLPGKFTLILKKRRKGFLEHVAPGDTLGVRIPKCSFSDIVNASGVPFVTTSVNLSGEEPIADLKDLSEEILEKVDVIVNGGKLCGRPSSIVFGDKIVER